MYRISAAITTSITEGTAAATEMATDAGMAVAENREILLMEGLKMNQILRVTVLIENTSGSELTCEHGLSLFIEFGTKQILLDAGSSEAFSENAAALGVPLAGLDAYVLSHGHYDHSGGFEAVFRADPNAKIYARKEALDTYLSASGGMHEISIPQNVAMHRDRFIPVDGIREILPDAYLVPHTAANLDRIGEKNKLYKEQQGQIIPDDFIHEQSLVLDTENGLVIFNSCSHAGAINIISEAREACGQKPVYAYVGGLHMRGLKNGAETCAFSEAEIDDLCHVFLQEGIDRIYTGHCTGAPGVEKLQSRLGSRVHRLTTGMRFSL
ncbi:MAG: MBL fold metallo-hydrolase [Clostridiales bacterium]|nr:MBL fold metallo-hydrolase [Clostridiales bacterium]